MSTAELIGPMFDSLSGLARYVKECTDCPLHRKCRRRVPGVGRGSARVLFVGQAPGWEEEREGLPWIGQAGQWLSALVENMGLSEADLYWTNLIKCYPGRKRQGGDNEPPAYAIEQCQKYLVEEIRLVDPEIIVAVGVFAMRWFGIKGGIKQNNGRVFKWKSPCLECGPKAGCTDCKTCEDGFLEYRVIPVVHPAGIFRRMAEAPELRTSLHSILTQLVDPIEPPKFVEVAEWT